MNKPKLDFSGFHPLDHWPWEQRCWSRQVQPGWSTPFYGGPLHHLKIAWEYRRRDEIFGLLHKYLLCRFDKHMMTECWDSKTNKFSEFCAACGGNRRTLPPDEVPDWVRNFSRQEDE